MEFNVDNPHLCVKKKIHYGDANVDCLSGCYIAQVDAWCFDDGVMTMVVVIRDHNRNVIMSSCCKK